ncbi:MAG: guanitoxin biosynthesis heme-dependent pre-guanitoxin N-hydroxylase GntA [Chthoniobacterales bacterium]
MTRDDRIREQFRAWILDTEYPCVGAKAAFNSDAHEVHVYSQLVGSTSDLARDLRSFACIEHPGEYATFIAIFRDSNAPTEADFERLLWRQLQRLHEIDSENWDANVSSDPRDAHFSFSFAGRAFYVIGIHPNSSRQARRFPWTTLVFNPHEQFERLRGDGKWKRMQQTIRERDTQLQGSINPMLSDFGERSEAPQYSGRTVGADWEPPVGKCPFRH